MALRTFHRPLLHKQCDARFFYPVEDDGPGTLSILEFRCLLRRDHTGPHHVEESCGAGRP